MARKPTRKPARRQPLTRDRVMAAALELADAEGLDALSMRTLARAVGVEAMSLYNHVANKDAILDGLVELVVAEIELPRRAADEDWRAPMRRRAQSAHAALMHHRWATQLFVSRPHIGPNMLRYVDATLGCLREAGFDWALADHAWTAIDAYVYGFTLQKLEFPFEPDQYATMAAQGLPLIPAETFPHLHGLTLEVIARRHDGLHALELGLDLLLDGLERLRKGPLVS